jgi:hypothetical protein
MPIIDKARAVYSVDYGAVSVTKLAAQATFRFDFVPVLITSDVMLAGELQR